LPVSNPDQLYRLGKNSHCCLWAGYSQDDEFSLVSYDLYQHFRDNTTGFRELAVFQASLTDLGVRRANGEPEAKLYFGEFVSGNYFAMFGVSAYAGRALTASDDQPAAPSAAVMSYRVWQQKYALDPSVIGAVFNINEKPFTIVGIAPPAFFGDTLRNTPPDFYLPLRTEPLVAGDSSLLLQGNRHWLNVIGRVRAGAGPVALEAQMRVELQQWLQSHISDMDPNDRSRVAQQTLYLRPGGAGITSMRRDYEQWLKILMTVSGFVLLIVCANVANLMLVRSMERRQQTSLSMALGARPMRLVRQALTESLVLSLLGGAAGLAVAFAGTRLILSLTFQTVTASPALTAPHSAPARFRVRPSLSCKPRSRWCCSLPPDCSSKRCVTWSIRTSASSRTAAPSSTSTRCWLAINRNNWLPSITGFTIPWPPRRIHRRVLFVFAAEF
jgi:hypothetical protein